MRRLVRRISTCLTLLGFSGCALHTPHEVVRCWADYNTERHLNAQVEVFDHLPPKTARVKLMRWGYNLGPECQSGTGTMGIGTGIWAERIMFWNRADTKDDSIEGISPPLPPGSFPSPASPSSTGLPPLPPAPPMETQGSPPDPLGGNLTTARPARQIATVGYQTSIEPAAPRAANAAWMFTPPPAATRSRKP